MLQVNSLDHKEINIGGNSQWSIGWDDNSNGQKSQPQQYKTSAQQAAYDGYYGQIPSENIGYAGAGTNQIGKQNGKDYQAAAFYPSEEKTLVKIHNPPGGKSSFTIGGGYGVEETYKQPALKSYDMNTGPAAFKQQQQNTFQSHFGGPPPRIAAKPMDLYGGAVPQQQNIYGQQSTFTQQQQSYKPPAQQYDSRFGNQGNLFGNQDFYPPQQQQQPFYSQNNYDVSPQRPYGGVSQSQQQRNQFSPADPVFGQRVQAGNNCGPTTEKSSVKLHAPPGGKSSIQFF